MKCLGSGRIAKQENCSCNNLEVSDDFTMAQRVVIVFEEIEEKKSQSSPVLTAEQQQSLHALQGS